MYSDFADLRDTGAGRDDMFTRDVRCLSSQLWSSFTTCQSDHATAICTGFFCQAAQVVVRPEMLQASEMLERILSLALVRKQ